jgi:hypothetical protein
MERIVYLNLAGVKYPLLFSMQALVELCEKYGSLKEAMEQMGKDNSYQTVFDVAEIFSKAAVEYCAFHKKKARQLHAEELRFGNPFELGGGKLYGALMDCIGKGAQQTVEAEGDTKNAEAAQG